MNRGQFLTRMLLMAVIVGATIVLAYSYIISIPNGFIFSVTANSHGEGYIELAMLAWAGFYGVLFMLHDIHANAGELTDDKARLGDAPLLIAGYIIMIFAIGLWLCTLPFDKQERYLLKRQLGWLH